MTRPPLTVVADLPPVLTEVRIVRSLSAVRDRLNALELAVLDDGPLALNPQRTALELAAECLPHATADTTVELREAALDTAADCLAFAAECSTDTDPVSAAISVAVECVSIATELLA